jgi:hypothetical protein
MRLLLVLILIVGCGGSSDDTSHIYKASECLGKTVWTNNTLNMSYIPEVKRCEDMLLNCVKICDNYLLIAKCEDIHRDAIEYCSSLPGYPK